MEKIVAIALGGALGSLGRYLISMIAGELRIADFPAGTFTANIMGCLLIGVFWSMFERIHISNEFRLFIFTGFLGGFTTFSTFARETVQLFKAGEHLQAFIYLALSNFFGISMVAAGFILSNKFLHWSCK